MVHVICTITLKLQEFLESKIRRLFIYENETREYRKKNKINKTSEFTIYVH